MEMNSTQVEAIVKQVLNQLSGSAASTGCTACSGEIPKTAHVAMLTSLENIEIKETEINEEVSEKPIKIRKRNYKKSSNIDEEIIENELENNETE